MIDSLFPKPLGLDALLTIFTIGCGGTARADAIGGAGKWSAVIGMLGGLHAMFE